MFYSDTLLGKTGALSRVWLSANIERKLSKNHILQTNVKDSVEAIITPNQAPMALRLSGHLLLGVARIYSRKARYLLDDCNEALVKIKMAFRLSGNNDIPAGLNAPSRDALMLPDMLTEGDNLEMPPMPDISLSLSQMHEEAGPGRKRRAGSRDINLQDDFGASQFLQNSVEDGSMDDELALDPEEDLDLGLDFGLDVEDFGAKGLDQDMDIDIEQSIEIGRDAPAARAPEDDLFSELDVQTRTKDIGSVDGDHSLNLGFANDGNDEGVQLGNDDGDVDMFDAGDHPDISMIPKAPELGRNRISESPLSDVGEEEMTELQRAYEMGNDESMIRQPQRAARARKPLVPDENTTISKSRISELQANHDKILQAPSFLPRDPQLLALMEMAKNGAFVSNIMGEGRSAAWAPELRGMLSLDTVRRASELKRKRDSGISDMGLDQENANKSPRLDLGQEEDLAINLDGASAAAGLGHEDTLLPADGTIIELAGNEEFNHNVEDDGNNLGERTPATRTSSVGLNFDETMAPLVHPQDSGPVSLGTKHAVHFLRERFGSEAANNSQKRSKAVHIFQDMFPEASVSRNDATKMFFEVLVLATKDAIKIEQTEGILGGPIRVRAKRGLWGAWAEREAGGEIAEEEAAVDAGVEAS